jgi:hypothetical protein
LAEGNYLELREGNRMMRLKLFTASTLMILMAGSLTACSTNQNRTASEAPIVGQGEMNQPVNYQATAEQDSASAQESATQLKNLKPGQPVSYYSNEFSRLGFNTVDVNTMREQRTYDLRKGQDRYVVSLITPDNQEQVSQIDIQQYRLEDGTNRQDTNMATDTEHRTTTDRTTTENAGTDQATQTSRTTTTSRNVGTALPELKNNLKPGKQPHEYISAVAKYGRVHEYDADNKEAEIEFEGKDKERYQIHMTVDPQTQKVTQIDVDQPVWNAF